MNELWLTIKCFLLILVMAANVPTAFSQNWTPLPDPNPPDFTIPPSGVRNILVLVADDMGIDKSRQYIPVTGNTVADLPATPTIRRLWKSGMIFHNAWANPVCSPTRAGFLTGRHSFRTGVTNAIGAPGSSALDASEETLPELISGAGYVSGLFGKWHLGGGDDAPRDQGFDHHAGVLAGDLDAYDSWDKYVNGVQVDGDPLVAGINPVTQYATQANVLDAFDWISGQNNNWLAVVAFNAPHTDNSGNLHTPTASCDGVDPLAGGDINAMIECVDFHIDWLLTELSAIGELENTTIIFIGDNGTDANSVFDPFAPSANPSHKMEVYEGGIRVPFIISDGYHLEHGTSAPTSSGIGHISSPGRRDSTLVHTTDIFATVAAIAGEPSSAEDSVSLIRYMDDHPMLPRFPRGYIYTDRCSNTMFQAAIRDSQYKLVYRLNFSAGTPDIEVYDVNDLVEANPLVGAMAEAILMAEMENKWNSVGYDPENIAGDCP